MLEDLKDLAQRSHNGTSFSPERRGEVMIKEYEAILQSDLELIKEAGQEVKDTYVTRFKEHLRNWMNAKSRIVSPMISGPANFPVRRMEKLRGWEESAYNKFKEFREKALTGIQKQIQRDKPEEQKLNDRWESISKSITSSAETVIAIDNGTEKGYRRTLFVNSITGLVTRLAQEGNEFLVNKSLELIQKLNEVGVKPVVTSKNKIWQLEETVVTIAEEKRDQAKQENKVFPFDGGEVTINYEIDRVQVRYGAKPSFNELHELKAKGLRSFNWSPSNKAWQRKLTRAALYDTEKLTGIKIDL